MKKISDTIPFSMAFLSDACPWPPVLKFGQPSLPIYWPELARVRSAPVSVSVKNAYVISEQLLIFTSRILEELFQIIHQRSTL